MEIIVGTVILKDNKILMVKEAKKECAGKWACPAGHLEKGETVFEGAKRELLEETGCKAEFKKAFPIIVHNTQNKSIIMLHFLADLLEEGAGYDTNEIIETKWISMDEINNMKKEEFRSYAVLSSIIESIESKKLYDLDLYKNLQEM